MIDFEGAFKCDLTESRGYSDQEAERIWKDVGEHFVEKISSDFWDNWSENFPIGEKNNGNEMCPHCDHLNQVDEFKMHTCTSCGKEMLPCSQCTYVVEDTRWCNKCPLLDGKDATTHRLEKTND